MSLAIKIENLYKDFRVDDHDITVLHGINIDIYSGAMTMLIGPSGCGKTTFISIITGILSSTRGSVHILNKDLMAMSDYEKVLFRRKHIGFIFQQYNLMPALTAAENAAIPLIADGMNMNDATDKAISLLETMSMGKHVHKLPRQLSGGQQQRVAITRALVHDPTIIVCDEPTAALDGQSGNEVMEILRHIADDSNRCVLVVSHDSRVYHYSDRIIEMLDGVIVGDTTQIYTRER